MTSKISTRKTNNHYMKNRRILLLCFLLPIALMVMQKMRATDFHFTQISSKDGLSQNTVRSILQDKQGFIWAGTLDGLNRYDGYQIITFKPQRGNKNSLADHRIKEMFEDRDGYLWIKTYNNVFSCYDPVKELFVDYSTASGLKQDELFYLNYLEASSGDLWFWGNTHGCLRVRKNNGKFEAVPFLNRSTDGRKPVVQFLMEDSKGTIWMGGNNGIVYVKGSEKKAFFENENRLSFTKAVELKGKIYFTTQDGRLFIYDIKGDSFRTVDNLRNQITFTSAAKLNNDELLLVGNRLLVYNTVKHLFYQPEWTRDPDLRGDIQILIDEKGGIWSYNHTGVMWFYNVEAQSVSKHRLIPAEIARIIDYERYNVLVDNNNMFWITTYGNGLFNYNPKTGSLRNFKYSSNGNSLSSDYLLSITEDNYGNIWIGSEYGGIIKLTGNDYTLRVIRPEYETSLGKNNNVKTIYEDTGNNIWVGTKNGSLYVYDSSLDNKQVISENLNPYAMVQDKKQRMWVGTKGNGISLIDTKSLREITRFKNDPADKRSLSYNEVFNILVDNKHRVWIGTFGGGVNLVQENGTDFNFRTFFNDNSNRRYVRFLFQDSKGRIWTATSDGIIRFNPDELINNPEKYVAYKFELSCPDGLNSNDIKTIFEDSDGQIWVGTAGGGLNKFVESNFNDADYFEVFTTADGLSGDIVTGILEDKDKNLWVSSESGLSKFDKKQNSFVTYHFHEKTYGNHFNENANIYSRSGNMLWGTLDGLILFDPWSFVADESTSRVVLTNFLLYDQKVMVGDHKSPLEKSISYSEKIRLKHDQNTFTIEFATLILKNPGKNKYTYMLENYDKQWSTIGNHNTATYKKLPPGKYVFKVKGTNNDGIWSDEITSVEIRIASPWWASPLAYFIYFVLLVITLYFSYRLVYKFYNLNQAVEIEKQLTNHKLRFFTNISHEFRTPLTLIQGAVDNLREQTDVPERIKSQVNMLSRNSNILTKLIDQLLEFRKLQNNVLTLDLEEIDMVGFAKEIFESFEEAATQKNIDYQFHCELPSLMMFVDRRKTDKILFNLLSNAFKFTNKGGKIELRLEYNEQDKKCLMQVLDNGVGIDKEKQHLIFSRFMQINFSASGTGVGLSLVKEFVDVHKGKVWYENNTGGGSVFCVELSTDKEIYSGANFISRPLPDKDSMKPEPLTQLDQEPVDIVLPEIDDAILANVKMLIIEDNDDMRTFLVEEFSRYFMVDCAENGVLGLKKAIDTNPDMIICDVMMPEMDGFEVTRQLKEEFQTCHIPIILLTAHSSIEHRMEGLQSGADAYITKPFNRKFLLANVFKLIEQREQLKKRFSNEYVLNGNLVTTTDKDKDFYTLINKILDENISDSQFNVDKFAQMAKQRRTIFYKKVKGITGLSPNELIKVNRLKKAAELLLSGEYTVSEISYKVGFEDPFYFSKCFKAQYKTSPSKYGHPKEE